MKGKMYRMINKDGIVQLPVTIDKAVQMNDGHTLKETIDNLSKSIFRFRIMSWNIGHYSNGVYSDSAVTAQTYEATKNAFRKVFNDYSPDFIALNEYSSIFYDTHTSRNDIFGQYLQTYEGVQIQDKFFCNAAYANFNIENPVEIQLGGDYKAYVFTLILSNRKTLKICNCHLPWNGVDLNLNAVNTLISYFQNDENVILAGDMNFVYNNENTPIAALEAAGYQNANWGYLGSLLTSYSNEITSDCCDNIAVKGGSILKTQVLANLPSGYVPGTRPNAKNSPARDPWDAINLSDHFPMICDIEFPL